MAINNLDDDAQKRLSEGFNSLIVIAAPKVVQKLMEFHNFVRTDQGEGINRDSKQWAEKHDIILQQLVKEIRKDIYGVEKNIDEFLSQVHLIGKKP